MSWKKYQQDTADLFRSIGWDAEVEKIVKGARGKHEIDVYVSFKQHDINCTWIIECKCWNSSVPKEKVLALQAIVDDVGADKGVLVSKDGFHSGAITQAQKSNIYLTSLDELVDKVKDEIRKLRTEKIEVNLIEVQLKFQTLVNPSYDNKFGFLDYGIQGMDGQKTIVIGWLLNESKKTFDLLKLGDNDLKIYEVDETTELNMNSKIETHPSADIDEYLDNVELVINLGRKWLEDNHVPI